MTFLGRVKEVTFLVTFRAMAEFHTGAVCVVVAVDDSLTIAERDVQLSLVKVMTQDLRWMRRAARQVVSKIYGLLNISVHHFLLGYSLPGTGSDEP